MRVRKFSKRGSAAKFIGKFPSLKLDRTILWGSQLIRDYLYLLEFDPDVLSYCEQPLKLHYIYDGPRYYAPNFLVERSNKKQIIEVKAESQPEGEASIIKYRLIDSIFRQEGFDFLIITDKIIRAQPRLDNIKLLWKYARTPITPQHQILYKNFMRRNRQAPLRETVQFFESHHVTGQVVYALMYQGVFVFDLMRPINSETILHLPTAALAYRKVS